MSDFSHIEHGFDPQVFDRLVDGELPEPERREVLLSLDRQPDGWRQCALAFLEAQTWGQSLTQYVREPALSAPAGEFGRDGGARETHAAAAAGLEIKSDRFDGGGNVPATPQTATSQTVAVTSPTQSAGDDTWGSRWRTTMAIAGSFLVTFSLGMYAQRYFNTGGASTGLPTITSSGPNTGVGPSAVQMVPVKVKMQDGREQLLRLPSVDNQLATFFAQAPQPQVPADVREAALRTGREIRVHREFRLVQLADRQILVPIDWVELVPAPTRGVQ